VREHDDVSRARLATPATGIGLGESDSRCKNPERVDAMSDVVA
jgi:hypothetical protein